MRLRSSCTNLITEMKERVMVGKRQETGSVSGGLGVPEKLGKTRGVS